MKKKLLTILLSMIMLFSAPIYAKDKEKEAIPGRAIFVMAPDYPIHIQSKHLTCQNQTISINVKVPQIKGLKNKTFEGELNKCLLKDAVARKKQLTKEAKVNEKQSKGLGLQPKTYELIRNFTVKQTIEPYVVVGVFEYSYTGGAHGRSDQHYKVIDKKENHIVTLKELFKEGIDYQSLINEEIRSQIPCKKANGVVFYDDLEGCQNIAENQTFYINEDGNIVIVFNVYEIAPYVSGIIEFTIPNKNIKNSLVGNKEGA